MTDWNWPGKPCGIWKEGKKNTEECITVTPINKIEEKQVPESRSMAVIHDASGCPMSIGRLCTLTTRFGKSRKY